MLTQRTLYVLPLIAAYVATVSSQQPPYLPPGVLASGTMGLTNPPRPTMNTAINQTSMARLITANSIEDFCIFGPPTLQPISDSETFVVAWCTLPRNNARLIPDGTFTGLSFLKTDMYIQIMGYGNLTQLNIPYGDYGGELDPHGAYGTGNPIGGNVTSNISGTDLNYQEWMLFISFEKFCLRICTNANATYSAPYMCWHQLDIMGCEFVMPGNYKFNGTLYDVLYNPILPFFFLPHTSVFFILPAKPVKLMSLVGIKRPPLHSHS
ncbi:hypothetical protein AMATHDRAFT_152856 [Amanita thiersii Skay4041]|uniref:Uncharacterized protein n=1 Tax=Amanita thiersii Skay4041 TaxID=703135 RepID=A0A2A9NFW6_9AGAR|nr:hypothetical protein AMATHDRAFT_152856 [Amanita thiersii Skay4041]